MPQTGYTPIQIYSSSTPTNAPSAGNLTNDTKGSELAINIADKNLFFKDSSNVVNTVPIRQSGAASDGWLSSTDWNTFNNKQPAGAYLTAVTADAPLSGAGTSASHLVIAQATTSTSGYLSSTDWNTFNNKQAALVSGTNIKTVGGVSLLGSGDVGTIGTGYGGTGLTSFTSSGLLYASNTSTLTTSSNLTYDGTTFIVNAVQKLQGIYTTLGNSAGQANNAAVLRFNGWNTAGANWQIDTANLSNANELAFTPSTTAGGLTFTTPVMKLHSTTGLYLTSGLQVGTTNNYARLTVTPAANGQAPTPGTAVDGVVFTSGNGAYGTQFSVSSSGYSYIQAQRFDGNTSVYSLYLNPSGGNVILGNSAATVFNSGGVSIGNTTDPGATNLSVTGTGKFGTTVGVGAATPAASGAGITFPATQSASSDANTLDDYEEGTFTPTITASTGTITSASATGSYTKIGRQVTIYITITITNNGTGAGTLIASGLPFTCNASYRGGGVAVENVMIGTYGINTIPVSNTIIYMNTAANTYPVVTGSGYQVVATYYV